jgi:hypothetical protein
VSKFLHMRRFGQQTGETPQEMHARLAWRGRRCRCGGPPAILIRVLAPFKELYRIAPDAVRAMAHSDPARPGQLPIIRTIHGPMIKTSEIVACANCAQAAERAAAHGPSWVICEIDRGPDPKNRLVTGYDG